MRKVEDIFQMAQKFDSSSFIKVIFFFLIGCYRLHIETNPATTAAGIAVSFQKLWWALCLFPVAEKISLLMEKTIRKMLQLIKS